MGSRQLVLDGMPPATKPDEPTSPSKPPKSPAVAVQEFHKRLDLPIRTTPVPEIPEDERELRIRLILEEAEEFVEASRAADLVEIADALADLVYVTYGAALHYGLDLDEAIAEVHRANMSKIGRRGEATMRADGKVLKGRSYRAPDLESLRDE